MKPIQVLHWCRETFHYCVVFTNSILFILGLILSYKLVENTFLNILITRLTDAWEDYDLRIAVVIVNLQEGTSAILVPVFVYLADVYTGRFLMVVFSTTLCIIGLLLNFVAGRDDDSGQLELRLFYPALGLMALGDAGQTVTLQAFLDDQLRPLELDEDRRQRCSKFWVSLVSFVAAIFAQFGPLTGFHLRKLAIVFIGVMGGCFLVFLLGTKYYNMLPSIPNPFKQIGIIVFRAIANRNLEYPQTTQPHIPWLRWLDRAAEAGSVEEVRKVKLLLMTLPLWFSFLTLSLVSASGTTFFYEEASSLTENKNPILFLHNLMGFTTFAVSETSSYVVGKLEEKKRYNQQKMELVRIGIGMSCCVPCCLAAWVTATRRQRHATMSVFWLTPQYFLLGLMSGLSQDGLESFYESQVFESLSAFGPPFTEFVMALGKFMSILCVLIFSNWPFEWFGYMLEYSRLDKYYILLAVLSGTNAVIYCLVACLYKDDAFLVKDEENGNLPQHAGDMQIQLLDSFAPRSIEGQKEQSTSADMISESSKNEVEVAKDEGMGIASPIEGQRVSRRTVSKTRESSSRDVITESSSSTQQEEDKVEAEDVLRRAVNKFKRLISRAARRRSDSTVSKNE